MEATEHDEENSTKRFENRGCVGYSVSTFRDGDRERAAETAETASETCHVSCIDGPISGHRQVS